MSIPTMDKKRKYFEEYLKFNFTSIVEKSTVKEYVEPSKFIQHLEPKPSNTSQSICSKPVVVYDSLPAVYCCEVAVNIQG